MDMKNSRGRVNVKFQRNVFLINNTALFVLLPTVSIDKLLNLLRPACWLKKKKLKNLIHLFAVAWNVQVTQLLVNKFFLGTGEMMEKTSLKRLILLLRRGERCMCYSIIVKWPLSPDLHAFSPKLQISKCLYKLHCKTYPSCPHFVQFNGQAEEQFISSTENIHSPTWI